MTTEKIYGPWIKWHGGERPVPPDTRVQAKLRYGTVGETLTADLYWNHDDDGADIVEYRAVTEQADLDAAERMLRNHGYTVTPPAKPLTLLQQVAPGRLGMKQRGYYDLNVTGFIIGCLVVGIAIGIAIAYLVPWLWSFIKPVIHALTA